MLKSLLLILAVIFGVAILVVFYFIGSLFFVASGQGYKNLNKKMSNQYYAKDNEVYYVAGGNFFELGPRKIDNADLDTFKILSKNYAKDKNKAYFMAEPMETNVALQSFDAINEVYAKDNQYVYYFDKSLPGVNPNSFEIISDLYSKDENQVLFYDKIVIDANPKYFKPLWGLYARDNRRVYYKENTISLINNLLLKNVENDSDKSFLIIGHQLFLNGEKILELSDLSSFRIISNYYFMDSGSVYYYYGGSVSQLLNSDSTSFIQLSDGYAKDKNNVYYFDSNILDIDPSKFNVSLFQPEYKFTILSVGDRQKIVVSKNEIKDIGEGYSVYNNSVFLFYEIINGVDVETFEVLSSNYAKDKYNIYFQYDVIENADEETFKIIDESYSKDINHVFYKNKQLTNSDPASFGLYDNSLFAKDKNHVYYRGLLIKNINSQTFMPDDDIYVEEIGPGIGELKK